MSYKNKRIQIQRKKFKPSCDKSHETASSTIQRCCNVAFSLIGEHLKVHTPKKAEPAPTRKNFSPPIKKKGRKPGSHGYMADEPHKLEKKSHVLGCVAEAIYTHKKKQKRLHDCNIDRIVFSRKRYILKNPVDFWIHAATVLHGKSNWNNVILLKSCFSYTLIIRGDKWNGIDNEYTNKYRDSINALVNSFYEDNPWFFPKGKPYVTITVSEGSSKIDVGFEQLIGVLTMLDSDQLFALILLLTTYCAGYFILDRILGHKERADERKIDENRTIKFFESINKLNDTMEKVILRYIPEGTSTPYEELLDSLEKEDTIAENATSPQYSKQEAKAKIAQFAAKNQE